MGPLSGIKVVELAMFVAGPAAAAALGDWGADVGEGRLHTALARYL